MNFILDRSPAPTRRSLRPRTEPKSYAEVPDIVLLPAKSNGGRQANGFVDSGSDDELPPLMPMKVNCGKQHMMKQMTIINVYVILGTLCR